MKYRYIGQCEAGFVKFQRVGGDEVVMREGEAVEVPTWLGLKLANNNHFEAVVEPIIEFGPVTGMVRVDTTVMTMAELSAPKKRGPKPKPKVTSDTGSA